MRIDSLIRELWRRLPTELANGEVLRLVPFDGGIALLSEDDGWEVFAERYHPEKYGKNRPYKRGGIFIPAIPHRRMRTSELVDHVMGYLRLLVSQLSPFKPPKGWRLFGRTKVFRVVT